MAKKKIALKGKWSKTNQAIAEIVKKYDPKLVESLMDDLRHVAGAKFRERMTRVHEIAKAVVRGDFDVDDGADSQRPRRSLAPSAE